MNILALDTSTEYLSLALSLAGELHTHDSHAGQSHSREILPALRALLDKAGIEMQALDGIAFGAGPGSFTGLRIGCGVAQGLAFGAGLPVVGISTLMALAQNTQIQATQADRVIACLPALVARNPNVRLVLGGTGPCAPALEAQARALGVSDQVRFLGELTDAELPEGRRAGMSAEAGQPVRGKHGSAATGQLRSWKLVGRSGGRSRPIAASSTG